ncbi:MAG TPA: hypothetical protein VLX92_06235 [Kofleriaceae bacterium]|nr:hypothetical protein [Kofleriaceae bacterium]
MRTLLVVAACSLVACATEPTESSSDDDLKSSNLISSNLISSNLISSNLISSNLISSNLISSNELEINELTTKALVGTADGRLLLSFVIGCAIPADVTLVAYDTGAPDSAPPATPYTCEHGTCSFDGSVGLAPEWLHHPLDADGRGWVSACMFSRVNGFGLPEEISLRGANHALVVSRSEAQAYSVQEGAFYGDMFDGPGHLVWIACEGDGQRDGVSGELVDRECARPDPANPGKTLCGFTYAGWCSDGGDRRAAHACDREHDGWYDECDDGDGHGHGFAQVITTYVTP